MLLSPQKMSFRKFDWESQIGIRCLIITPISAVTFPRDAREAVVDFLGKYASQVAKICGKIDRDVSSVRLKEILLGLLEE